MFSRSRLAAACVLLAAVVPLGACGLHAAGDPGAALPSSTVPVGSSDAAPTTTQTPAFGKPYAYPGGIAVTVSRPTLFRPSSTAHPQVDHAVSFEITIANPTERPYRLADLGLTAWINGERSTEVIDSTQGYTGVDAGPDLPPSRKITLLLAYGSDSWPQTTSLRVQPDERASAEFTGTVAG